MSQISQSPNVMQDDQLADFTDQLLAGRVAQAESAADEELLALEETVLRLQNAFPPVSLDQSTIKQMNVRFNARVRRETREAAQPFWKKWFEPQARLQFGTAFAATALLIVLALLAPPSAVSGSATSATALTPVKGSVIAVTLTIVLVFFLWTKRRK